MDKTDLCHTLNGLPLAEIARTLAGMGGRDISLVDLAETGLPDGTPLGPGLVAGEARIVITFGMPSRILLPPKRVRIVASHLNGHVLDVLQIERFAK